MYYGLPSYLQMESSEFVKSVSVSDIYKYTKPFISISNLYYVNKYKYKIEPIQLVLRVFLNQRSFVALEPLAYIILWPTTILLI